MFPYERPNGPTNNCFKCLAGHSSVNFLQLYKYRKEACFRKQTDIWTASCPYMSADATDRQYLHTQCAPDAQQTAVRPAGMIWGPGLTSGPYWCTEGLQTAPRRHPP